MAPRGWMAWPGGMRGPGKEKRALEGRRWPQTAEGNPGVGGGGAEEEPSTECRWVLQRDEGFLHMVRSNREEKTGRQRVEGARGWLWRVGWPGRWIWS